MLFIDYIEALLLALENKIFPLFNIEFISLLKSGLEGTFYSE